MTETERTIIHYAIRLAQAYHDQGGSVDDTNALQELLDWIEELERETGVNLAYLHKRYALAPDNGVSP